MINGAEEPRKTRAARRHDVHALHVHGLRPQSLGAFPLARVGVNGCGPLLRARRL
jgi:hypothetical protein